MRHLRRIDDPDKVDWGKVAYLLALALITAGALCAVWYAIAKGIGNL